MFEKRSHGCRTEVTGGSRFVRANDVPPNHPGRLRRSAPRSQVRARGARRRGPARTRPQRDSLSRRGRAPRSRPGGPSDSRWGARRGLPSPAQDMQWGRPDPRAPGPDLSPACVRTGPREGSGAAESDHETQPGLGVKARLMGSGRSRPPGAQLSPSEQLGTEGLGHRDPQPNAEAQRKDGSIAHVFRAQMREKCDSG